MSFEYSGLFSDLTDTSTEGYVKLLTSGLLVFTTNVECDVFLVGGGGNGSDAANSLSGGGGGGGYTKTYKRSDEGWRDGDALNIPDGFVSTVVIGEAGETTSFTNTDLSISFIANSGFNGGGDTRGPNGGNGGSGGGGGAGTAIPGALGGSNGGNGSSTNQGSSGTGQGHTTREFGEEQGSLYAAGGGGGGEPSGTGGAGGGGNGGTVSQPGQSAQPNTGGGGGGAGRTSLGSITPGGSGGSGIVVIRWRVLGPGPGTGYPAWMTKNGVWVRVNKVMV